MAGTTRQADQNEVIVEETRRSTQILESQLGLDARASNQPGNVALVNMNEVAELIKNLLKEYIKDRRRNELRG